MSIFEGKISNVKRYNKCLTPSEVNIEYLKTLDRPWYIRLFNKKARIRHGLLKGLIYVYIPERIKK